MENTIRALMIDDDREIVQAVRRNLGNSKSEHFEIESAGTVEEGERLLDQSSYDVILLSLCMFCGAGKPCLDPFIKKASSIPVVVLSDREEEQTALDAVRSGAQDYLIKEDIEAGRLEYSLKYSIGKMAADNRAKETAKLKSNFISIVSHELRTPLTAIKQSVRILADGMAGFLNEDQRSIIDVTSRNVERLEKLISDILTYQQFQNGKTNLRISRNDINDAIMGVYERIRREIERKGLEFVLDLAPENVKSEFDWQKMVEALQHIISNAVEFTDKGRITVSSRYENNTVVVRVSDTGPGIVKEDIDKIFCLFEQLGSINDRKTGGVGIGLALTKEIVELHGGKLWVESEVGKGSVFSLLLPVVERRSR